MFEFEKNALERLKIEVRKPTGLKIDEYLEKYGEIRYAYDFGDGWQFTIKLEEIVDDYYFGYPTLLDGEETSPPEDVGGLHGFYEFLKAYRDERHPEHQQMKMWAKSVYFREYDPDWINNILKGLNYKKTEWNKINHENYMIIEDKYRKS
ncbi:plasmid pRiA4b ORF-3 family protein [Bacillus sp. es.034]|uniref:plasmid pRiA4b ORF-3 family protein n=1 Tax=Bacillus sp. es.034 TaxID=1761763 RepID=UPI0025703B1F|nr:plasmid pRiA4b ORF-3 family protein [Bacillus sp. es.034]